MFKVVTQYAKKELLLWWVDPGQQPNIHPASCSLPFSMGQGEDRRKVRRPVDRDDDSLIQIAKAVRASKAK